MNDRMFKTRRHAVLWTLVGLLAVPLLAAAAPAAEDRPAPRRVIWFIIDGLRADAPRVLELEHLNALADRGACFDRAELILPAHPHSGAWKQLHDSSIPNPVMQTGTVFIEPGLPFVQELFESAGLDTVHSSSWDYSDIARGHTFQFTAEAPRAGDTDYDDRAAVEVVKALLKHRELAYARVHLQAPGVAGWQVRGATRRDDPPAWAGKLYADGSPYVRKVREADAILGDFVAFLEAEGLFEDTLLLVFGDHGNALEGGHHPEHEGGWTTPLVITGPGVARGRRLPYAEHIDIAPTTAHAMGLRFERDNGGYGRPLTEIYADTPVPTEPRRRVLHELNRSVIDFQQLFDRLKLHVALNDRCADWAARAYTIDNFLDWKQAGSPEAIVRRNRAVIDEMNAAAESLPGAADGGDATHVYLRFTDQPDQPVDRVTYTVDRTLDEDMEGHTFAQTLSHTGPIIENRWSGLRVFFHERLGVDAYTKRRPRLEIHRGGWYPDTDKPAFHDFGFDKHLVGEGVGLGGLRLWDGQAARLLASPRQRSVTLTEDPARMTIAVDDIPFQGRSVSVTQTITAYDHHRFFRVDVRTRDGAKLRFATGLGRPETVRTQCLGHALVSWGEHPTYTGERYDKPVALGLALLYHPDQIADQARDDHSRYLVTTPTDHFTYWLMATNEFETRGVRSLDELIRFIERIRPADLAPPDRR